MCSWCGKETRLIPQASGVKIPMICESCGGHKGWIGWKELRDRLNTAESILARIPDNVIQKYMGGQKTR